MSLRLRRLQAEAKKRREEQLCAVEAEQSANCLREYEGSQEVCRQHIANYKACKSFWDSVRQQRRRANIEPHEPPFEEREQIKAAFFRKVRGQTQGEPPPK